VEHFSDTDWKEVFILAQEQYGFFNSTVGDERSYDSADMAAMLRAISRSGVADGGSCLRVTAEGSTMRTLVDYGSAMVEGYYFRLRDDGGGVKAVEHTTEAELNRIDRIVLRLNLTERTVTLQKLIGTAASTPQAPTLTRGTEIWELSLAQVLARASAAELLPSDILDERGDEDVCGLMAPQAFPQSVLEQMIDGAIDLALAEETIDVLRHSAQTLLSPQQAQARLNIGAQEAIAASGLLKGNGSGGVVSAAEGTDFIGADNGKVKPERASAARDTLTASATLALGNAGKLLLCSNSSAITITIPADMDVAFPTNTEIEILRWSDGAVTVAPASGVTLYSAESMRSIAQQWASVCLKKIDVNIWLLTGYLA
jgi:hypothetical protein